jgi:DNA repair photolyase
MADVLGKLQPTDTVMVSTMTDAWSPEAQEHDLGRRCLDQILRKSKARVRVLTKNAVVAKDLDLLAEFHDRVSIGLSLTAPLSKAKIAEELEPKASSIQARLDALRAAHEAKVPVFGMLCPCLPGVADSKEDLEELFQMVMPFAPEAIWAEPVNARGNCLVLCQEALQQAGQYRVANEIRHVRSRHAQTAYTVNLIANLNAVASKWGVQERLRILVYDNGEKIPGDSSGVIWLKS